MKFLFQQISLMILFSSIIYSQIDSSITESSSSPPEIEIIAFGGTAFPHLPTYFKDYWSADWNVGFGIGLSFTPGDLGYVTILYPTFEYSKLIFSESGFRDGNIGNEYSHFSNRGSAKIYNIMINLKGSFSSTKKTVAPYFLIGLGMLTHSSEKVSVDENGGLTFAADSKSGFAWSFGLGLEIPVVRGFGTFVEGKSVIGIVNPARQYFPVNAGIKYRF